MVGFFWKRLVGLMFIWGIAFPCSASPPPQNFANPVRLTADADFFNVQSNVEYLLEQTPLSLSQITSPEWRKKWRLYEKKTLNFRFRRHAVWLRFNVVNDTDSAAPWVLEIPWPLLDRIELNIYSHTRGAWLPVQRAGDQIPPADEALPHRYPVFPLSLGTGERISVYLRVQALDALIVPLQISRQSLFEQSVVKENLFIGLLFGILGAMFLYNSSLFLFTRDRSFLFYAIYVSTIIFYELSAKGLGSYYIWGQWPWIKESYYGLFAESSFLAAALFVRQFLSLKHYGGWVLQLNNVFVGCWIFTLFGTMLFSDNLWLLEFVQLMALSTCVAGLVTTIYLWAWKHDVSAKYFTIAWSLLILFTMLLLLAIEGILDLNPLTRSCQSVGFVIEVMLLSFALGERINRERIERIKAQQAALEMSESLSREREAKMRAQTHALDLQQRANEELELRVRERTAELRQAIRHIEIANKKLSKLSMTDPLTRVYNRRYFDAMLGDELKRANRMQSSIAILLLDLDHFKAINDTYGHLVGDECLRQVAQTLERNAHRSGDLIARYGGEEFVFALPATNEESAMALAERVRLDVEQMRYSHEGKTIPITVSIGVAARIPGQDEDISEILNAADGAMYSAKQAGRNCVVAAAPT